MLLGAIKAQLRDVDEDGLLDDVHELLDSGGVDAGPQLLEVFLGLHVRHGDRPHLLPLQDDHLREAREHFLAEGAVKLIERAAPPLPAKRRHIIHRDKHLGLEAVDAPLLVLPGPVLLVDEGQGSWLLEALITHDTDQSLVDVADHVGRVETGLLDVHHHLGGDHARPFVDVGAVRGRTADQRPLRLFQAELVPIRSLLLAQAELRKLGHHHHRRTQRRVNRRDVTVLLAIVIAEAEAAAVDRLPQIVGG